MSIYDDPEAFAEWSDSQPTPRAKRNTVYKKGETIRQYKKRVLHIYHPQTEAEWKKASKKRRSQAQKGITRTRSFKTEYANPFGLSSRQRRWTEEYQRDVRKKDAASMGVEDMRALLKDDHWEEVCGHKRWMYDRKSTIKEFNKYMMSHRDMY